MLTISSGYDPGYLTRAVATGRENYYLSAVVEHGEPPGIWTGLGCPELGLPIGSEVDNKVMERLYGAFIDSRDPAQQATLGRAPSRFGGHNAKLSARIEELLAAEPEATPERRDQIILQTLKQQRAAVYFFDATFSVPKSVSLLHASLQVKAQQACEAGQFDEAREWTERAQTVWDGILTANRSMLEYLQREAGYSRAGYHAKGSGRFADAHEWVIASFAQHTSRDNDPQLHVHNAILNRVLREDPLAARVGDAKAWRTLDGAALYAVRPAAGAIAERSLAEYLSVRLGVQTAVRPDGNGWEIVGISEELRDQFSSRRQAITPRLKELIEEYEQRHDQAPNARAIWSMAQFITLDSRPAKTHSAPSRETLLARWEAQSRRAETEALSGIPEVTLSRRDPGAEGHRPCGAEVDRILVAAVADAQQGKATFSRYELTRMINRYLPDFLGGLSGGQVTTLLDELTSEALQPGGQGDAVLLTAPEMVPVPQEYRRADGLSLWRRHGAEIYTTRAMLDTETRLLHAAAQAGAPRLEPERAAAALGVDRERVEVLLWRDHVHPGANEPAVAALGAEPSPGLETHELTGNDGVPLSSVGLADDQAQAAYGILTSGRAIDILVGAAGTGKTRTVATIAEAWRGAGLGNVIGLTTSTNAAHALASEGLAESRNFADFLGRISGSDQTRGHLPVRRGDLLVIDEASMVATRDLAAVEEIATRNGVKILLTGDTEQLSAPQAGGVMRLLADEHGYYQLQTVQRFEQEWERGASLRLRAGDADTLSEYDQRGRILAGTRERMSDTACQRWLADHLSGKSTILLVTTNAQAAGLARRARDELAALGLVAADDLAELRDGNVAGVGDLIVARENDRIRAGAPRRWLANRDVLRIDCWDEIGEARVAIVRRMTGRDRRTGAVGWSAQFELPEEYIERHVDLAYAGNIHVAEGRTVETAHLVVDEMAGRESLYVGITRGSERNTAYVVTERERAADLSAEPRPAPALEDPGVGHHEPAHRLTVLAQTLEREQVQRTAIETVRQELEQSASLATLAPIWVDVTRIHATRQGENTLRSLLTSAEWQRYERDAERGTLTRLLRAAELAGHDVGELLNRAAETRDFAGAHSIAAVLHGRVRRLTGTPEPSSDASYAGRTPVLDDPQADRLARDLAAAMDERVTVLGNRAAADRPVWALRYLGELPADPLERDEWTRRAGIAAAYREERGYTHEAEAIGPAPERGSPEQRASWHAAYTALRMADENRDIAAATDGQLWTWRNAYSRETAWAPPYVVDELRDAHLAEDAYQADAVHAWHRADATVGDAAHARAQQEAEEYGRLAQEVGAYREALTEVADTRRRWHAATEDSRRQAFLADAELRRRHPDAELPPLHAEEATRRAEGEAVNVRDEPAVGQPEEEPEPGHGRQWARGDIAAALAAARQAQKILSERSRAGRESDEVMRRREAEALREISARHTAVRQEPPLSRRATWLEPQEPELEAGQ